MSDNQSAFGDFSEKFPIKEILGEVRHKIDVHHHFIPEFYRAALEAKGVIMSGGMTIKHWTLEENLKMMDHLGIQIAMNSISEPGVNPFTNADEAKDMARKLNEFSADAISKYPDRFGAFAVIPMNNIDIALEEIVYSLDVLKLDGIGLLSNYESKFLGNKYFDTIFDELNKRKAIIHLHPSSPASTFEYPEYLRAGFMAEFPFNTTRAAANLIFSKTMHRCPDIKIILSHGGGTIPFLEDRLTTGQYAVDAVVNHQKPDLIFNGSHYMKKFYYDTALTTSNIGLAGIKHVTEISQILYGSDANFAPEIAGARMNAQLKMTSELDSEEYKDVMYKNALQLFPRFKNVLKH